MHEPARVVFRVQALGFMLDLSTNGARIQTFPPALSLARRLNLER